MSRNFANDRISRRDVLKTASCGFGYMALAGLCTEASAKEQNPLSPKAPHFEPRAKRVIFMFMRGGPSHVDTFDYKPQLAIDDGKDAPNDAGRKILKSPWDFVPSGESGLPISEVFPNLSKRADDMCLINGMWTDLPNHPQASILMHTGSFAFVRPSVGAWTLYGLGTENQNLPGFVTISPSPRIGGTQNYGSAFLPSPYEGTRIGSEGEPLAKVEGLPYIANPRMPAGLQRKQIDLLQVMNRERLERDKVNGQLEGVIRSYELGFNMQSSVPELMDLNGETQATLDAYGVGAKETDDFGRQCLMARRFAEAGVRYVEVCHSSWDHHSNLSDRLGGNALAIDRPIAALMDDLDQRGLLDDTLIVWGGEFGRTPHARREDGRDHNSTGFSMWMAGGGIKGGMRYGATDEYGIASVENKVHIHDLHATMLHLMGLNHEQLTYRYSGRDFRLTDVYGRVIHDIIA